MKLLRKKTVTEICNNAIESILFYADNFLHGDISYGDFLSVVNKEYYVISKVGGKKWVKIADNVVKKKIEQGIKEVDTNVTKKGDKK